MKLTLPKLGLGSPSRLLKLQSSIAGVKHLTLGCSLYHWKGSKVSMSKMGLHGPFGHL